MRATVDQFKVEPEFQQEKKRRGEKSPDYSLTDEELLKSLIELIAYSQQAKAKAVNELVKCGNLDKVFQGYNLQIVASLTKDEIMIHGRQTWAKDFVKEDYYNQQA